MKFTDFWKTYRREVTKLLTTHFALSVFGIVCASPFLLIQNGQTKTFAGYAVSIFTFAFYYYLVRTQMWPLGAKAHLSEKKISPASGFLLGLFASVPSLICNILYFVGYIYQDYEGFSDLHSVMALIEAVWDAEALGFRIAANSPYAYLTASLLPILFSGIAFYFGTKEFSLFGVPRKDK